MRLFEINSEIINYYAEQSVIAINELKKVLKTDIRSIDFQDVLGEKLGYVNHDTHMIAVHRLSTAQMLMLVGPEDFLLPDESETVVLEESILPEGTVTLLTEERIKAQGEIWLIHKNDQDPLPSNPHGHNVESGYKLHLGNGNLYTVKNKPIGKSISKKDLQAIRAKVKSIKLPRLLI